MSLDKHEHEDTKHRLSFEERRRQHRQQWSMDQYPPIRPTRKIVSILLIHRGYYTAVRRYEFYLRVVKTIFHE